MLETEEVEHESKLLERYLKAFYVEDLNAEGDLNEERVRAPAREEIRQFLDDARRGGVEGGSRDDGGLGDSMKGMHRFGSGYMHGRAASIMRLFDPRTGRFRTNGIRDREHLTYELQSLWMVAFYAILCFGAMRSRIWGPEHWSDASSVAAEFWEVSGLEGSPEAARN